MTCFALTLVISTVSAFSPVVLRGQVAEPRSALLVPCGHMAMCTECSMRVLRGPRPICVVCRQPIEKAPPLVTSPHTRACAHACAGACACPCARARARLLHVPPSVTFVRLLRRVWRMACLAWGLLGAPC